MKQLSDLLYKAGALQIFGTTHLPISSITADSRQITPGALFLAIKGTQIDGHQFIAQAIEKGASAIVCENFEPSQQIESCTIVKVSNSTKSLGIIASNFYDNPSLNLKVIGVTGTNGKTTVSTLLYQLFTKLGYSCGLLSTISNIIKGQVIKATHTTPDPITLQKLLAKMVQEGCSHVFMEVSSHAAHQYRIAGISFSGALFTNLTHDHLDYHGTFANYRDAKQLFFNDLNKSAFAITNKDDKNGLIMTQNTQAKVYTYALKSAADYKIKILENNLTGLVLLVDGEEVHFKLAGKFNAYNIGLVYATAHLMGIEKQEILMHLSGLDPVNGRFELLRAPNGLMAVVDYAHTPDALQNILETLRDAINGQGNLITVVGCGGNRDKAKRPLMANLATALSFKTILTSDNPRSEDPKEILKDMYEGLPAQQKVNVLQIVDRHEAIKTAVLIAQPGDLILIAGKGHETYQEIAGVKHPFDDKAIIIELFKTQVS